VDRASGVFTRWLATVRESAPMTPTSMGLGGAGPVSRSFEAHQPTTGSVPRPRLFVGALLNAEGHGYGRSFRAKVALGGEE
jgi:hypothetical protein